MQPGALSLSLPQPTFRRRPGRHIPPTVCSSSSSSSPPLSLSLSPLPPLLAHQLLLSRLASESAEQPKNKGEGGGGGGMGEIAS